MSEILVVGVNHKAASLEMRERLAFSADRAPEAMRSLAGGDGSSDCQREVVILSTCNRSEFYFSSPGPESDETIVRSFLVEQKHIPAEVLENILYIFTGEDAVRHLFRVASGLDSLITGENEILGQVKDAYAAAQTAGTVGPYLSRLFQHAVQTGKKIRSQTDIGRTGLSVATVVVELAEETFGSLAERKALLIGAGKISSMTARALVQAGLRCILIANRTFEKAEKLASALKGQVVHFDALLDSLIQADIVISSTGAPHIVLHQETIQAAMQQRPQRHLLIADLAVPRDVDPSAAHLANVSLTDIDGLEALVHARHPFTAAAFKEAEDIVDEELNNFTAWLEARTGAPIIAALESKASAICADQVSRTLRRLPELTAEQQHTVEMMGKTIANQLLHGTISSLKHPPDGMSRREYYDLVQSLFKLGI